MQERIAEYVAMLKAKGIKSIPDYETPARECASYFDGRGIDMPNANDWEAFKEYFTEKFKQERGRDISPTTLQQNYVARGKAFYRWCASQDGSQQTAPLFAEDKTEPEAEKPRPTEATAPAPYDEAMSSADSQEAVSSKAEGETIEEKKQSDTSGSETEKAVRTSLLIDARTYKMLALLAALENKTMTEILTAGAHLYIKEHSHEAEKLQEAINARSR